MQNTRTVVAIIVIVLLAVLLLGGVGMLGLGGFGMMGPGMMGRYGGYGNMMGGFGFGGMLFGGLLMLLFWVLIAVGAIWLVVTLVRGSQNPTGSQVARSAPLGGETVVDILKIRYAKGEITKEQFEQMKRDLQD